MTAPGWGNDRPRPNEKPARSPEPDSADDRLPPPDEGPPGGSIFTLEGKRAPGLYLIAWLLAGAGLVLMLLIGPMANSRTAGNVLIGIGMLVTTAGIAAGAGYQVVQRQDRHPDRYRGPSPLLAFGAYLLLVGVLGIAYLSFFPGDPTEDAGNFVVTAAVRALGWIAVVWLFAVRSGAFAWADMGWPTWEGPDLRRAVTNAAKAALLIVPVSLGIAIVGGVLGLLLNVDLPEVVPMDGTGPEMVAVALLAVLVIPVAEEVFFRGFSLTAWRRDLGDQAALIRSSVFFALIHIVNISDVDFGTGLAQAALTVGMLLPVGFAFGWMFLRWGLIGAIAAHATYNGLVMVALLSAGTS